MPVTTSIGSLSLFLLSWNSCQRTQVDRGLDLSSSVPLCSFWSDEIDFARQVCVPGGLFVAGETCAR